MVNIFRTITKFYDKWNIQGFIMLSLFFQIILLLLSPFKKRSRNRIVIGPIWLAYLLADWAAPYAIGLISSHHSSSPKSDVDRVDILAFWAIFLLLHLSGPDNVSVFSIEDSSLWRRHLTGLISQLLSTIIVFSRGLPRNKLWICTILVFVAGTIKNGERTYALYLANPDFNPYRDSLIKRLPDAPTPSSTPKKERRSNVEVVKCAYNFLAILKSLAMGVKSKKSLLERSRHFFSENDHLEAFRVLEVELNLIYEVFYTKVFVVYSTLGRVFRYIYWCMVVGALLIFSSIDKHGFRSIDVHITYSLLFGTIGLDAVALFMFVTSELGFIYIDGFWNDKKKKGSWRHSLYKCFLPLFEYFFSLKATKWRSKESWVRKLLFGFFYWVNEILFSRWSRSLHTYNLINYCLRERNKNRNSNGLLKEFCDSIKHVSKEPVEEKLWEFIFTQLKHHKCRQRIDLTYENEKFGPDDFGDGYHHTVLILHIATDLCYEKDKDIKSFEVDRKKSETLGVDRKNSKLLSDYMLYLQVMEPALISATLGIVKIRLYRTCDDAKNLFSNVPKMKSRKRERAKAREECLKGGAKDKSLRSAVALVKKLESLRPSKRWELISKLWVELLFYAAGHYKANKHIAQLNKGGELITFVWLLIAHFGMRDDFQSYNGIANIIDNYG